MTSPFRLTPAPICASMVFMPAAMRRRETVEAVAQEVAQAMAAEGFAWWNEYDQCWSAKRNASIAGVVFAVTRCLERRGVVSWGPVEARSSG